MVPFSKILHSCSENKHYSQSNDTYCIFLQDFDDEIAWHVLFIFLFFIFLMTNTTHTTLMYVQNAYKEIRMRLLF